MWLKNLVKNKTSLIFFLVALLGIGLRIYSLFEPAHSYDIGTFHSWGATLNRVGIKDFYRSTWSDYLPLPLYALGAIYKLSALLNLSFELIFKLSVTIIELLLIFAVTKQVTKSKLLLFSLLTLSPALFGDTSYWGQIDTLPALMTLLALLLLKQKTVLSSAMLFGLAVATKPIMILVAPVLWIMSRPKHKVWRFPLLAGLVFLATGLPMGGTNSLSLLWERTLSQAATYPYASINALNLYSLAHDFSSWVPDNRIILGVTPHQFGLFLFSLLGLNTFRLWKKSGLKRRDGARVAATILVIFFTFTTRMHERHLLFGLPLLTLAAITDRALILPLVVLSLNFVLNLWGAYHWLGHDQTWPFSAWVISLVSWTTTLVALGLATIWNWSRFFENLAQLLKKNLTLVLILLLAFVLRTVNLAHPPVYIFDEVYHAFTAREYLHNHREAWEWWTTPPPDVAYEWTHPPVAKYAMVAGMLAFGENSYGWRFGSALAGTLSILGLYLLVVSLTKNKKVALLSAFLLSVEGLHLAQSRLAMNDVYMLLFVIWSLCLALKSKYKPASILFGLALASKWSALYTLAPLALIYLRANRIPNIFFILRLLIISLLVYTLSFTPFILAGHSWQEFVELHRQMWYYHTHLVATHAYQSTPGQWIFAARPVWYWVDYGQNLRANIYAQGNPLILWLGLGALLMQINKIFRYPYSILYTLYFVFTLPWLHSPRIMFFYHYLPSVAFLTPLLALYLGSLPKTYLRWVVLLIVLSFVLISPMLYGTNTPNIYWDSLFKLFPSWK